MGTKFIHFAAFLKGMLAQVSKILPAFTWPRSPKRENDGDRGVRVNLRVSLLGLSKKLGCKTCVPREGYLFPNRQRMRAGEDVTGFQANHSRRRKGGLEGDVGAVGVKQRLTLSHPAVRVQARSPTSQSRLEVTTVNLPGLLGCILMGKRRRK